MSELGDAIEQLVKRVEQLEQRLAREAPAAAHPQFLTVNQAADRLAMSVTFIRDAIRDRRLPAIKIGRSVRIAIADVDVLLASGARAKATPATPRARAALIKIGGGR